MMNNSFLISKKLLEQNGELVGVTSGNSMCPLFRDGKDRAVIVPVTESLRTNDVLLYRKPNSDGVVLHRIIKISDGHPVLRGDALYFCERDVQQEDVVGVMKGFYRNEKYYSCDKSIKYKIYVFYIRSSYPLRRFLHKIKSFLKIIKRKF